MKKILLLLTASLFSCITNTKAQIYPVRPQLSDKHSFSMILLPDPQSYNKFDANQPLFELQTAWIANSIGPLNVKGVLCTGDLVEQNEIRIPDGVKPLPGHSNGSTTKYLMSSALGITITDTRKQKTASAAFPIIFLPSGMAAGKSHWSRQV